MLHWYTESREAFTLNKMHQPTPEAAVILGSIKRKVKVVPEIRHRPGGIPIWPVRPCREAGTQTEAEVVVDVPVTDWCVQTDFDTTDAGQNTDFADFYSAEIQTETNWMMPDVMDMVVQTDFDSDIGNLLEFSESIATQTDLPLLADFNC